MTAARTFRRGFFFFTVALLAAPIAAEDAGLDSLTKAPSDPDELRQLVKAGKLWKGSCRANHQYGYIVASKNPYTRTGTGCPFHQTPVGGGASHPCPWAMKFYKEDEQGLDRHLQELKRKSEKQPGSQPAK